MASVQWKNNNLYVVYRKNLKEGGQSKSIYEKQHTKDEAKAKLRANYINELFRWDKYADPADPNDFHNICALDDLTLGHFLDLWVPIYAPLEWSYSSYINNLLYINKHIKPDEISKIQIRDLTPTDISAFLGRLAKKETEGSRAEALRKRGENVPYLSPKTIKLVRDCLSAALNSAVRWWVINRNPMKDMPRCSQLKKREARRQVKYERKIWAPEYMFAALKDMEETDPLLHLAVHLSFMSLSRGGETTAVTLDSIDFEQRTIQLDKTIQRVYFDAIDAVSDDELIFVFPNKIPGSKSAMVLKRQKTPKSDRVFYMTKQLEANIRQRISYMEKAKEYFGDTHTAQRLFPACTSPACARVYLAGRAGVLPDGYGRMADSLFDLLAGYAYPCPGPERPDTGAANPKGLCKEKQAEVLLARKRRPPQRFGNRRAGALCRRPARKGNPDYGRRIEGGRRPCPDGKDVYRARRYAAIQGRAAIPAVHPRIRTRSRWDPAYKGIDDLALHTARQAMTQLKFYCQHAQQLCLLCCFYCYFQKEDTYD